MEVNQQLVAQFVVASSKRYVNIDENFWFDGDHPKNQIKEHIHQGFPQEVLWWQGPFAPNSPKTAWKLQKQFFGQYNGGESAKF